MPSHFMVKEQKRDHRIAGHDKPETEAGDLSLIRRQRKPPPDLLPYVERFVGEQKQTARRSSPCAPLQRVCYEHALFAPFPTVTFPP